MSFPGMLLDICCFFFVLFFFHIYIYIDPGLEFFVEVCLNLKLYIYIYIYIYIFFFIFYFLPYVRVGILGRSSLVETSTKQCEYSVLPGDIILGTHWD